MPPGSPAGGASPYLGAGKASPMASARLLQGDPPDLGQARAAPSRTARASLRTPHHVPGGGCADTLTAPEARYH